MFAKKSEKPGVGILTLAARYREGHGFQPYRQTQTVRTGFQPLSVGFAWVEGHARKNGTLRESW